MNNRYHKIAVKVGSNVLTRADGMLDINRMNLLVEQISRLRNNGIEIILISSGAVAAGKSEVQPARKHDAVSSRQLWSAVGQVHLINTYHELFSKYDTVCAQVLTTKENFRDRMHYLNMKNCLTTLLENRVVPIINENDTIAITELMFTDNDELSGLIAAMMDFEALVILSNVDGIYTDHPDNPDAKIIREVNIDSTNLARHIRTSKSEFGRGGMITKSNIARKVAEQGIHVHIANGKQENILLELLDEDAEVLNTHFIPNEKKSSGIKKWLAHSDSFAKGILTINEGACAALLSEKASSLLLIGVEKVQGYFKKGDIIKITDQKGNELGLGKTLYDSDKANLLAGSKKKHPIIHYDHLYLYETNS
ncbi:MAG: glutamate 5-kinase [Bacteroidota bacterium]|nr:glutamate 5-kinase [Bacteroidota bacterium]